MMKLKPCPHCGKPVDYAYNMELEPYGVHCVNCHMIVRYSRVDPPKPHEIYERVMAEIAVRWNRRAEETR